jgi:hypothetical protein
MLNSQLRFPMFIGDGQNATPNGVALRHQTRPSNSWELLLIDNASDPPVCGYISDESQGMMIIAGLDGGLGNQLFQYAMGRSLSVKRGVPRKLDLSSFQSANEIPEGLQHFVRSFQLSAFKIVTNLLVIGLMRWFIGQIVRSLS